MKIKVLLRNFRRRYREPTIRLLIKLFARLPFSAAFKIGGLFGWVLWVYNGEMRKVSEVNVAKCFPEKSDEERRALVRQSLIETGKNITEIARLWFTSESDFLALLADVKGEKHITNAIESGRGVMLIAPHLGAWEYVGLYLSVKYSITSMYRPPEMSGLADIIQQGRTRFGATLVPTDIVGVRELLSALKRSELVGMLPDQDPGLNGGEFSPLFNVSANTMTLTSKLAQKTNADVIACFARRKKSGVGYELIFEPANKRINDKDMVVSLGALNEEVEKLILKCPEQYQWSYKRFKTRPQDEASFYN